MVPQRYVIAGALISLAVVIFFEYPLIFDTPSYEVPLSVGVLPAGATFNGNPTTSPMVTVLFHGNPRNYVPLQYLAVTINGAGQDDILPPKGSNTLVGYDEGNYPVQDPNNNHVVVTGHFSDGTVKVLADTVV